MTGDLGAVRSRFSSTSSSSCTRTPSCCNNPMVILDLRQKMENPSVGGDD